MKSIKEMVLFTKQNGIKAAFKKFGWRFVGVVFVYYLVRDLTIYVVIPALVIGSW